MALVETLDGENRCRSVRYYQTDPVVVRHHTDTEVGSGVLDRVGGQFGGDEDDIVRPSAVSGRSPLPIVGPPAPDGRGDTFRGAAERLNLRAVAGYPLIYNRQRLGALNVYHTEPREWSAEAIDVIGVFADMATAYLVRTSELAEVRQLADQLQSALDSRVVVEQAKGILAGEYRITVDEAFELLRGHSRSNQIKLSELARAVVEMGLRIPRGEK